MLRRVARLTKAGSSVLVAPFGKRRGQPRPTVKAADRKMSPAGMLWDLEVRVIPPQGFDHVVGGEIQAGRVEAEVAKLVLLGCGKYLPGTLADRLRRKQPVRRRGLVRPTVHVSTGMRRVFT